MCGALAYQSVLFAVSCSASLSLSVAMVGMVGLFFFFYFSMFNITSVRSLCSVVCVPGLSPSANTPPPLLSPPSCVQASLEDGWKIDF